MRLRPGSTATPGASDSAPLPVLRTVTAAFPSPSDPRRAHFIETIHRGLATRFRSEILAPRLQDADPLEASAAGYALRRFSYPSRGRSPRAGGMGPLRIALYLRSALRASRVLWPAPAAARVPGGAPSGLVLAHWVVPAGWVASRVARRLGVPLVLYAHGSDLHRYGRRAFVRGVVARLIAEAACTVVASGSLARLAARLSGRPESSFPVVPVGIEEHFFAPAAQRAPPPPWRLLWVGDLIPEKGIGRLLAAFLRLRATGRPVELCAIGSGPFEGSLRRASAACGAIRFAGVQDGAGVSRAMRAAHVLVLPSVAEGTPLSVEEAIAVNLPVAASAVGAIPDLFAARSGWISLGERPDEERIAARLADFFDRGAERYRELETSMAGNERRSLAIAETVIRLRAILEGALR